MEAVLHLGPGTMKETIRTASFDSKSHFRISRTWLSQQLRDHFPPSGSSQGCRFLRIPDRCLWCSSVALQFYSTIEYKTYTWHLPKQTLQVLSCFWEKGVSCMPALFLDLFVFTSRPVCTQAGHGRSGWETPPLESPENPHRKACPYDPVCNLRDGWGKFFGHGWTTYTSGLKVPLGFSMLQLWSYWSKSNSTKRKKNFQPNQCLKALTPTGLPYLLILWPLVAPASGSFSEPKHHAASQKRYMAVENLIIFDPS